MNRWSDAEIADRLDAPDGASRSRVAAIDVHSHFLPPAYQEALREAGISRPDGYHDGVPRWSTPAHLEQMEQVGIETAVVSISTPGVVLGGGVDPVRVARQANEAGADLMREHPGRFGFYAALPLPDMDAALAELDRSTALGAWGVSLLTHTEGVYLGDPRLEPLFAELSRRGLTVLIHPTAPAVAVPGVMDGWSKSMYEFFFDTTRTVINLIFSGTLERHPGIRLVIPHAGAALPALAQRIERNVWRANRIRAEDRTELPGFLSSLRRCYFDLAGSVLPYQVPSLLSFVEDDHIVYGSDFPYTNARMGSELNAELRTADALTISQKRAVLRGNAFELFPHLAAEPVGAQA